MTGAVGRELGGAVSPGFGPLRSGLRTAGGVTAERAGLQRLHLLLRFPPGRLRGFRLRGTVSADVIAPAAGIDCRCLAICAATSPQTTTASPMAAPSHPTGSGGSRPVAHHDRAAQRVEDPAIVDRAQAFPSADCRSAAAMFPYRGPGHLRAPGDRAAPDALFTQRSRPRDRCETRPGYPSDTGACGALRGSRSWSNGEWRCQVEGAGPQCPGGHSGFPWVPRPSGMGPRGPVGVGNARACG